MRDAGNWQAGCSLLSAALYCTVPDRNQFHRNEKKIKLFAPNNFPLSKKFNFEIINPFLTITVSRLREAERLLLKRLIPARIDN